MPAQKARMRAVKVKMNPMRGVLKHKKIILIDDSIVRGTTMKEMIKMIRECKVEEIHLRITCPPIKAPCFYGVDMPTYEELIANNKSVDEIREYLGVDSLHYLTLDGLKKAVGVESCFGCLTGDYPTPEATKQASERRNPDGCHKC